MVLALALVTCLTAPLLLLPRAHAQPAGGTPLPCTENNNNGCTELSPTPPEDTVAVPPNIMLMLDDSGSMRWDVMPDYGYLSDTSTEGLIDSDVNGVYYNPTVTYTLPPKADGTLNAASDFSAALVNGFDSSSAAVDLGTYRGRYDSSDGNYSGTPVQYSIAVAKVGASSYTPSNSCPSGSSASGKYDGYCYFTSQPSIAFNFYDISNGDFYVSRCSSVSDVYDYNGSLNKDKCYPGISFFTYTVTNPAGGYIRHYVAETAGDCAAVGLASDVCDESAATRQNVANWFSYYHTRILMAKSGLMTAFETLSPKYRFGFGSINGGNNSELPSPTASFNGKTLAEVEPFGDGSGGTQKANFWDWISTLVPPKQGTPLRLALAAVGQYYQTAQPWSTLSSDPGYTAGSTTQFACRASYAILTTDGFWNGGSPGVGNVDSKNGPVYTPPAGKTYTVTGYVAAAPFSDTYSDTLADVAMYYWANDLSGMPNEVAPSPQDPAFWQHMTTFTMGLGFTPQGIQPAGTTVPQIFAWAQGGAAIPGFSWPTPGSNSINNIADLAHAAVNGHGDFFSAKSPQELAKGFSKAISDINARNVPPTPSAVNASVLTAGALTFETGYNTGDWSGSFKVVALNTDGTPGASVWPTDPDTLLNTDFHGSGYTGRKVYTDAYNGSGSGVGLVFNTAAAAAGAVAPNAFDSTELAELQSPAPGGGDDTLANRIKYLLGDSEYEGTSTGFRTRSSILGAIINASPVYIDGAENDYSSNWPAASPELATGAQSYDAFQMQQSSVQGMVYVAANDGMLHAFDAPAPKCTAYKPDGTGCATWDYGTNPGKEAWAFVPRAVYANLGNLTSTSDFQYRPTVDATPVSRDVFFGESGASNTDSKWHTILTGSVGLGGRGVYALDVTNPSSFTQANVLWEFDSDMAVPSACVSIVGTSASGNCKATDLGYTIPQPNIGRLNDGSWVVLVSSGYFPDCGTPDIPTAPNLPPTNPNSCAAIAAQAPNTDPGKVDGKPYSALFVLDAQTGTLLAELKTPDLPGVTSFGLATPVLGSLSGNNVDNVAYAGDVEGNLWKFTLGGSGPSDWTVSLVYQAAAPQAGIPAAQPITTMPRLFPDPVSNGFMVVFGTGKFLGVGDNSNSTVQSIYGVRDRDPGKATPASDVVVLGGSGVNGLTQNYLHEELAADGETLRCITGGVDDTCNSSDPSHPPTALADSSKSGGWYVNLDVEVAGKQANAGERVVVTPAAIFAANEVVMETLITGGATSDPCSPTTSGAIMVLDAGTGAPGGVSSLGGWPIAGARISQAQTSGTLPILSEVGGGRGLVLTGLLKSGGLFAPDLPLWRRRSWSEIQQNQ